MEKLTIKQALKNGYKYAAYRNKDEQSVINLNRIQSRHFDDIDIDSGQLVLCEIKTMQFEISADSISQLIIDYISGQEDMADEDGELCELASEADFKTLADDINKRMSVKNFYSLSDVELILNS